MYKVNKGGEEKGGDKRREMMGENAGEERMVLKAKTE